jgi:hypothetical protein
MSTIAGSGGVPAADRGESVAVRLRAYFFSDARRSVLTFLGLIWLLDGALQFQSFMYSNGFIQSITGLTSGQPNWVADSVNWGAHRAQANLDFYNTLFALVQVAIGLGLLYRPTVKSALILSFVWTLIVWWFGEAFGMLFMSTIGMGGTPMANALTGAPGAVLLYGLIGAIVWPNGRPGGLLGVRGARVTWASLWLLMAFFWLTPPSTAANATANMIDGAPSGMSWLSSVQNWFAARAHGDGEVIALVLAAVTIAIALAVARNWHPRKFLIAAIVLNLFYWVVGQGFGGMFAGGATDPNAGPLFILLACALYSLVPFERPLAAPQPMSKMAVAPLQATGRP